MFQSKKIALTSKKYFFTIFIIFLIHLTIKSVSAENMESSLFKIQHGEIGIAEVNKSLNSYNISDTVGQEAAIRFNSSGYIIKKGFQHFPSNTPFRFSISNININFDTLVPNSTKTASITLTISLEDLAQYQVTVIKEGKLRTLDELNQIDDTQCDGGRNTCNESLAKTWILNSSYGFGYNISGHDIPNDFINNKYFRPFPDKLKNENPALIMSSSNGGKNRQSIMTFKVNTPPNQQTGKYQTIINFVATPSF